MDDDVSLFFDDFAVTAKYGRETGLVILDLPEQILMADQIVTGKYSITYKTGQFTGLKYGENITVDGELFTCDMTQKVQDGKITVAHLSKV